MNRTHSLLASLLTLGSLSTLSLSAQAQVTAVPNSLNFQGRLATPAGNPVPNGTYSVLFSLYDALTGGTLKYSKTVSAVPVKNGTFAVTLDAFPANTFNGNLYLEIKIGSDAALTPRTPLVSVPYAMKSDLALTVPDGSITNAKIAAGTLNPVAWLLGGNSATNPATQFIGTTDNQSLVFRTNAIEQMRLTGAGRVGMGTNNPLARLHIAGGPVWTGNGWTKSLAINNGAAMEFGNFVGEGTRWGLGASGGILYFFSTPLDNSVAAANYRMVINQNGNVGIGTTTPQWKVDVVGSIVSNSSEGSGVLGQTSLNYNAGVWGISNASLAFGVYGKHTATQNVGLLGAGNTGVYGDAVNAQSNGVWGHANNLYSGVYGVNDGLGNGVSGTSAQGYGVYGTSPNNSGVQGVSTSNSGVYGGSTSGDGVTGFSQSGYGVVGTTNSTSRAGVAGFSTSTGVPAVEGTSTNGIGVVGSSTNGSGIQGTSSNSIGVYGRTGVFNSWAGYFSGRVYATSYDSASDRRFKENIAPIDNALEIVLALQGVTYTYRNDAFSGRMFPQGKQVGFIAQEVEKLLPSLVFKGQDGYLSLDYSHITPLLAEALKTQQSQLNTLRKENAVKTKRLEEVEGKNAALEMKNAQIEAMLKQLAERVNALETTRRK